MGAPNTRKTVDKGFLQTMKAVSLEAFFQTGSLGPIRLGMSRAQIQEAVGPPDYVGCTTRKYRQPSLWGYGNMELHFVRGGDELWLIHLENFQVPEAGGNLRLDPWIIRGGMGRSEVEYHLAACQLPFQQIQSPEENCTWLRVGAGIMFIFINERRPYDPPPGLFALSFSVNDR
jgi:hypothetical protein